MDFNDLKAVSKRIAFAILIPILGASAAFGQSESVSGTIKDGSTGETLPGVNILVRGTSRGTSTDADGQYELTVESLQDTLVVSFVGYQTQKVPINGRTEIDIALQSQAIAGEEMVVIGYGKQKEKNISGAVSSIKAEDLKLETTSSFGQALQGKVAGVQITQPTGQPGANANIQIRSNPSPNAPGILYVLDGVPFHNGTLVTSLRGAQSSQYGQGGVDQSPLNFINPNDIKSIEFLKDPSSTAIYGAEGGSGVVLITTKQGKEGEVIVNYNGSYSLQRVDNLMSVYGSKSYLIKRNELDKQQWLNQNNIAPYYGNVDINSVPSYKPIYSKQQIESVSENTYRDPVRAITRPGYTQQQNISISGGNATTNYFVSGNYFNQKGIILNSGYERYNSFLSLNSNISDKIKIGTRILISKTNTNDVITGKQFQKGGIDKAALYYAPVQPLQKSDGTYPTNPYYSIGPNPLSYETITNEGDKRNLLGSVYGRWSINSGLTAIARFGYNQSSARRSAYLPTTFLYGKQVNGDASIDEVREVQKSMTYTLNYYKDLAPKHQLNADVVFDYQTRGGDRLSASNRDFITDQAKYYNLQGGQAEKPYVGSDELSPVTSLSFVGRAIYTYDDMYTLTASLRRDGFSTFAAGKKWGYFPSVSASWLLSSEPFVKKLKTIPYLKLRAGFGEVGNPITSSSAFQRYKTIDYNFGSGNKSTGLQLAQGANPELSWETRAGINLGVDFGIFNSRLSGSLDYYSVTNRNLIESVPYPSGFIIDEVNKNAGKTRTVGYGITLKSENIVSNNFTWSTNLTFSHYRDYWVKRAPLVLETLPEYINVSGKDAIYNGEYGFIPTGLYKDTYGKWPDHMPNLQPGQLILKDIHGIDNNGNLTGPDGQITEVDQTLIGRNTPKYNFGIGNQFKYRNIGLSIYMSGAIQHKRSPLAGLRPRWDRMVGLGHNALQPSSREAWTTVNTSGNLPSGVRDGTYGSYQLNSRFWWTNASYLRLSNITLGYTLPARLWAKQNVINSIRFTLSAKNLANITSYPIVDPELNYNNYYPFTRSFVFSMHLSL